MAAGSANDENGKKLADEAMNKVEEEESSDEEGGDEVIKILDHDKSGTKVKGSKKKYKLAYLVQWAPTWVPDDECSADQLIQEYWLEKEKEKKKGRKSSTTGGKVGRPSNASLKRARSGSAVDREDGSEEGQREAEGDISKRRLAGDWDPIATAILRVDAHTDNDVLGQISWQDGTESWHSMTEMQKNCPQKLLDFLIPKMKFVSP